MGKGTPVTATSIGRKDQEPPSKSIQPMHTAPTHAHEKSHHKCSTGRWIARHGSAPCAQYSNDTRSHKWGPTDEAGPSSYSQSLHQDIYKQQGGGKNQGAEPRAHTAAGQYWACNQEPPRASRRGPAVHAGRRNQTKPLRFSTTPVNRTKLLPSKYHYLVCVYVAVAQRGCELLKPLHTTNHNHLGHRIRPPKHRAARNLTPGHSPPGHRLYASPGFTRGQVATPPARSPNAAIYPSRQHTGEIYWLRLLASPRVPARRPRQAFNKSQSFACGKLHAWML